MRHGSTLELVGKVIVKTGFGTVTLVGVDKKSIVMRVMVLPPGIDGDLLAQFLEKMATEARNNAAPNATLTVTKEVTYDDR